MVRRVGYGHSQNSIAYIIAQKFESIWRSPLAFANHIKPAFSILLDVTQESTVTGICGRHIAKNNKNCRIPYYAIVSRV